MIQELQIPSRVGCSDSSERLIVWSWSRYLARDARLRLVYEEIAGSASDLEHITMRSGALLTLLLLIGADLQLH
jgi:hypothetical protein